MNKDRSSTTNIPADLMLKWRGKRSKVGIFTFDIVQYSVYVLWSIEYQTQPLDWDAIIIMRHSVVIVTKLSIFKIICHMDVDQHGTLGMFIVYSLDMIRDISPSFQLQPRQKPRQ